MTCPVIGSTSSDVSLWYASDPGTAFVPDGSTAPEAFTWYEVPITGESLGEQPVREPVALLSSVGGYDTVKQGHIEVSGSLSCNVQALSSFYDLLLCALRADADLSIGSNNSEWEPDTAIMVGNRKHALAILKAVKVSPTEYNLYVFRGMEVNTLNIAVDPNSTVSAECGMVGCYQEGALEGVALPAYWEFVPTLTAPLMAGRTALRNFHALGEGSEYEESVFMNLSISIDNQYTTHHMLGSSQYSGRVFPGNLSVTYSGSAYYSNLGIYRELIDGGNITVSGSLLDDDDNGFSFLSSAAKIASSQIPSASGDEDLMVETTIQALKHDTDSTLKLTALFE
jgi:hypothetical protein